jgi:outer membrane protein
MTCNRFSLHSILFCVLLLGWATHAAAQGATLDVDSPHEEAPSATRVTLGLGAATTPDYEGSEDYQLVPVVMLKAESPSGQYFEFLGTTARANLVPSAMWGAGPMLRYRGPRDNVENNRVDRMKDIDDAWEFGAFGKIVYDRIFGKAELVYDLADAYGGYLFTLTGGYRAPINPSLVLTGTLSTTYADKDYMDTYFGVSTGDSIRSGLDFYSADAGFKDIALTGICQYVFLPKWSLMGALRYMRLLGDAEDSPVVDDEGDENQFSGGILVFYKF